MKDPSDHIRELEDPTAKPSKNALEQIRTMRTEKRAMERLNENLKMLRNMRERLSAMLARVKADPELQDSSELIHVTNELTKSLGAEIQALERAIAEIGKSQAQRGSEGNPEGPERT